MAELADDMPELAEGAPVPDAVELPREITEQEKRLRQEVVRYREQARIALTERDVAAAQAVRERDEAVAAVREEARQRIIQAEMKAHAIRAGIIDLDALRLADCAAVSIDEAGAVQGADQVMAVLQQQKPYLFSQTHSPPPVETTAALQRPPAPSQPSSVDARTLSREAWQQERDRLLGGR